MENKYINKYIVITSIFRPTIAIEKFSVLKDYRLLVVADKKTPDDWFCENVEYISIEHQENSGFQLSKVLPYNHYCRKMIGYLKAIKNGADLIIDTDDDNIPKQNWKFPEFEQKYDYINDNKGFVNIYQLYTNQNIWARGLPLNLIRKQFELEKDLSQKDCRVGIWQGLADEDPDVDAIYRLTSDEPCFFNERNPVVLGKGTISPFNTQNTIIRKELFTLMYLPTFVTFRFTDILRSLVAQPIMWLYDYQLGFTNATVIQKRNPHNYMQDFLSEIPMYQNCEKVVELVTNSITKSVTIENNLFNAYHSLLKSNIICEDEINTLEAWLKDLDKINNKFA